MQKGETGRGAARRRCCCSPPCGQIDWVAEVFEDRKAKSRRCAEHYARVAQERGCACLDMGQVIVSSDLDGTHLEASEQEEVGQVVDAGVRELQA